MVRLKVLLGYADVDMLQGFTFQYGSIKSYPNTIQLGDVTKIYIPIWFD